MVELVLTFERKPVNTFHIDKDTILIGRDPTCDVRIDNSGISRHHAKIEKQNDVYVLSDLGSGNGTFVKGEKVTKHYLNDGDEIAIWNYSIFFKIPKNEVEKVDKFDVQKIDPEHTIALNVKQLELKQKERASPFTAYLTYQEKKRDVNYSIMKSATFFGKSSKCEFKISGWFIQPRHAMIIRDEIGFRFINFSKSALGKVNNQPVDDYRLKGGDVLEIGALKIKFNMGLPPK
ncbi:MAG: FHA domain-containing protein [Candidatus Brocadiia bacterium]